MRHRIHQILLAWLLLAGFACPRGPSASDAALDADDATVDATTEEPVDAVLDLARAEEPRKDVASDDVSADDAGADDAMDASDAAVLDAAPPSDIVLCVPGRMEACRCADGRMGARDCSRLGMPGECVCRGVIDAGWTVEAVAARVLPPRLIAPQSTMRVTTQRPTLRWVAPEGAPRVRVELCNDRACTRPITSAEVSGASWRPTTALRPGVVFWRVRALDAGGGVTWASATWEFFVGRRDTPVDSSYGVPRDFDGDGRDDVAEQQFLGTRLVIRYGTDDFRFSMPSTLDLTSPSGGHVLNGCPTVGDFNGDGYTDCLSSFDAYDGHSVNALYGSTGGLSGASFSYRINGSDRDMIVDEGIGCDYNGDGYADLVGYSSIGFRDGSAYPMSFVTYPGSATGVRHEPQWIADNDGAPRGNRVSFRCVGDVNADGYADAMSVSWFDGSPEPGEMQLYFGTPLGLSNPPFVRIPLPLDLHSGANAATGGVGDVDGDGVADLQIVAGTRVALLRGNRTLDVSSPSATINLSATVMPEGGADPYTPLGSRPPVMTDVNGDGRADLVELSPCGPPPSSSERCGPPRFLVMSGKPNLMDLLIDNRLELAVSQYDLWVFMVGDFNGDGYGDTLLRRLAPEAHWIYVGTASGFARDPLTTLTP